MKTKTLMLAPVCCLMLISLLCGQQIQVSGPATSASSSFHENFGVNFGFSFGGGGGGNGSRVVGLLPGGQTTPNISFSQNNSLFPSFGGFDPNSGATFGFGRRSGNGGGFSLGFNLSQGSSRFVNSVTPTLTIPNGGFGTLINGSFRPFVTGVVPVVGVDNAVTRGIASGKLRPYDPNRVERTSDRSEQSQTPKQTVSSATIGDASVAAIRAEKERASQVRIEDYKKFVAAAKDAEANRDFTEVRRNIRRAMKLTEDPTQIRELRLWMKEYRGKQ